MLKWNLKKAFLYLFLIMIVSYTIGFFLLPKNHFLRQFNPITGKKNFQPLDQKKELLLEGVDTITISTDSPDLQLFVTDGPQINAHLYHNYILKDGTLVYDFILEQTGSSVKLEVKKNTNFVFFQSDTKLTVFLPSSFKGKLNVATGSADCELPQITELEEFTFQTGSGDLIANSVSAKQIKLTSGSGELELLNGACEQFLVTTASGEFTTRSLTATSALMNTASGTFKVIGKFQEFQFKSASGDLKSDAFESQTTRINTASGELLLHGAPGNVEAETMSGNITLNYFKFGDNITANTLSGDVKIVIPTNSGFSVSFNSGSGELNLAKEITNAPKNTVVKRTFQGSFGSGINQITINTTSGNAKILNR
ncbi:MAG TPA: DUF4097 family beta strand repeat-containing protein [Bacillota bacterium]|nr:DUF4097 family beta strand repeat-containing protein [Bacillota bacterium]HOL08632.1 DUF4097 family beta strand repeat-containing protein [Bacillota bacterium]HPO96666.1 DUF4097 family beta strand repeat-containing protein [Bacillota bacterium]